MMRTTVTLDPDVEAQLKIHMRKYGMSFKQVLNNAIRTGLAPSQAPRKRFHQKTYVMGLRSGVNLVKALQLAADLEDEAIVQKLELRK